MACVIIITMLSWCFQSRDDEADVRVWKKNRSVTVTFFNSNLELL